MKRRNFLTAVTTAGLVGCGPSPSDVDSPAVHTQKRVRWRLASSFPRSLDTIYGAAEVMAKHVEDMTDGRFQIRVHPAGEIVPALQVLDAVQQGTVHVGQTASYYYIGKNPVLAFDTCVPFGLTARQQAAWLSEAGGAEALAGAFSAFGVRCFQGGNTGVQMGGWFKRPATSVADLKGMKMRIPGLGGAAMERLGVSTQTIAGGEIYTALERGAIDATDWVGPYDDEKLGFHKVAKFYYYPGWWEPGPSLSYYVSEKALQALPAAYREILKIACERSGVTMQARYDAQNPAALKRIEATDVRVLPFSADILQQAQAASESLLEDQAAADPAYRKVFESWRAFRNASFDWFSRAELGYATAAFRPPGA